LNLNFISNILKRNHVKGGLTVQPQLEYILNLLGKVYNPDKEALNIYFVKENWEMKYSNLSRQAIVQNIGSVEEYLKLHPGISELLVEICRKASQAFPDSRLFLSASNDLEEDQLILYIRQDVYPNEFMEKVEKFREQFYNLYSLVIGDVHITTDFQHVGVMNAFQLV